jgi:pyruvate, water dikinase
MENIIWFKDIRLDNVDQVGGKCASLGEMLTQLTSLGVQVPNGFSSTAAAYQAFADQGGLHKRINNLLDKLDIEDIAALAKTGNEIREAVLATPFLPEFEQSVRDAYKELSNNNDTFAVAVRSSATAEDLEDASFAGQQESYLNVRGIDAVLVAIKKVFASLFNDRAIAYRVHKGFEHSSVSIAVAVQQMVRSDIASSGVMFSIDTESGFDQVVLITSSYGLGEAIVQGAVNPDEFYVHKPTLTAGKPAILRRNLGQKCRKLIYAADDTDELITKANVTEEQQRLFSISNEEVEQLARYAMMIEKHYKKPMDIEWAKDGDNGQLYIVQARPETVKSQESGAIQKRFQLNQKGKIKAQGRSVGQGIGQGKACVMKSLADMEHMKKGDVLVADMTDPDWEPVMSRASAIVTNRGGRTCHAAIIARELGIPAVVGCMDATQKIKDQEGITVSCAEGDTGFIYSGLLDFDVQETKIDDLPESPVKIMLNVGNPDRAFSFHSIPNEGVGLARLEFIINQMIGIHPNALLDFDQLTDDKLKKAIMEKTVAYGDPIEFYIERLKEGIATIAATFSPKPVIFRLSDFKSNEYANLLGGDLYEPMEENPMIGFRGASRYVSKNFRPCFELECQAVKRVRNEMGLTNVQVMIPFVRTLTEAKQVIEVLDDNDLRRGENGLKLIMMCELPSNALLAEEFLEYFDGFSIGSNDMTQLTLGLDRDSSLVADKFDERDSAVKKLLSMAIKACLKNNKYIGICGQGPSDHPDLAQWLMEQGIESMSLNPDSVIDTQIMLAKEAKN